ncbi:hypothetical protein MC47_020230 [Citrobacter freundii]|nr:hypothetical protein MC47_020230 [Citrobacter freundii]
MIYNADFVKKKIVYTYECQLRPEMTRLKAILRRHGVSGVGGSNPLVPTKNPLRTSLLRMFFYACFLNGEATGNYGGIIPSNVTPGSLPHND